jgi:hypothetical protein
MRLASGSRIVGGEVMRLFKVWHYGGHGTAWDESGTGIFPSLVNGGLSHLCWTIVFFLVILGALIW